jgi:hypothetical protein
MLKTFRLKNSKEISHLGELRVDGILKKQAVHVLLKQGPMAGSYELESEPFIYVSVEEFVDRLGKSHFLTPSLLSGINSLIFFSELQ